MAQQRRARLFEHPFIFGSFRSWLKVLWENKGIYTISDFLAFTS
jgi:hypothetical protein